MSSNSAGQVGDGNNGMTDMGRGSTMKFNFTKAGRKDGKVGGSGTSSPNSETVDGNKRTVSDPRLAP